MGATNPIRPGRSAALSQAWDGLESDPAIGGELDMSTGADLSASLSAASTPATAETAIGPEVATASPEVDPDIEM